MADNLMKVPAKGILKNSTSFEGSSSNKCAANRGTKWDEMNIIATHHPPDKDYGHMKIEEPKTPYNYHGDDSGDEADGCDLDSKLLTEKLQADSESDLKRIQVAESEEEDEDEEEVPADKEKRRSFEHKRKAHYNEFMAVKLARQLMQKDEDDDDGVGAAKEGASEVEEVDIDLEDTVVEDLEVENNSAEVNSDNPADMDTKDSTEEVETASL